MYIVFDIGGTHARMALIEGKPEVLTHLTSFVKYFEIIIKNDYQKDLAILLNHFNSIVEEFRADNIEIKLVAGAGAIAGAFSKDNKLLENSPHLSSWEGQNLAEDFSKAFGCPIVFNNDTYMAALGAVALQNPVGDFWYVNWGTGIGGALALDLDTKVLNNGWHYRAKPSELGHRALVKEGLTCSCGQKGCWDAYCAGGQLEKRFNKNLAELTTAEWKPVFDDMAQGLLNLYVTYPTDTIILNGGVIQNQADKLDLLQELFNKKLKIFKKIPELLLLKKGNVAGLIGSWYVASGRIK